MYLDIHLYWIIYISSSDLGFLRCPNSTQTIREKINQNCNKMQKVQNEDKSACVPVPPLIYTSNEPRQKCQSGQFVKECSVNVRINLLGHNFFAHAKMHPFSTL